MIDQGMILAVVSALIYLLLAFGILILLRKKIAALFDIFRSRYRLRPERAGTDKVFEALDRMLKATMKRPLSTTAFCVLTIMLFFTVFIAAAKTIAPGAAMITGAASIVLFEPLTV